MKRAPNFVQIYLVLFDFFGMPFISCESIKDLFSRPESLCEEIDDLSYRISRKPASECHIFQVLTNHEIYLSCRVNVSVTC